jgi:hypothetical protein
VIVLGLHANPQVRKAAATGCIPNNQGNATRVATLMVNPKQYKLTVKASHRLPMALLAEAARSLRAVQPR